MQGLDFQKMPRFSNQSLRIMDMIPQWSDLYNVARKTIESQIVTAHVWCNANPEKAPKKQIIRFLNTWMARAKEWGTLKDVPKKDVYVEQKPPEDEVMGPDDFAKMREEIVRNKLKGVA